MLNEADSYMRIVGGTIFTQAMLNAFNQIFDSNGKTIFGMVISFAMNIINIVGNALFLYGPLKVFGLGASGAAVFYLPEPCNCRNCRRVLLFLVIKGRLGIRYLKPFPFNILKGL